VQSCCGKEDSSATLSTEQSVRIVAWRALACRGQSMNWLSAVPPLAFAQPELAYEFPRIGWLGPVRSDVASGTSYDPAVPPPECA
jgi:hypothetical protein